ncbi:MAG: hypothetical protein JW881_17650 [Spirochaetales bacterium]|nr:hypothetical protein [Spirochaetales bacterium]
MARTIITIPDDIKTWLDHYSHRHHQSLAATIRAAIKNFKKKNRIKKTRILFWKRPVYRKIAISTAGNMLIM